jgi:electron transfer flavoprotein alpha subunit
VSGLIIDNARVTPEIAGALMAICPFTAIEYTGGWLSINAACRMCNLCVKNGGGIISSRETSETHLHPDGWRGIAVFADCTEGTLHNVTLELLGKARELSKITNQPVFAVLIGHKVAPCADTLVRYGANCVYVYDDPELAYFRVEPFASAFEDFVRTARPSSVLIGATRAGRMLAPRVAARFRTGLTADCTLLEMRENTDLVQIRPAFGGNIMARIATPRHRPQFCTVRYKVFCRPEPADGPAGRIVVRRLPGGLYSFGTDCLGVEPRSGEVDLSEAEVVLAVGRGIRSKSDLVILEPIANAIGAQIACTRPLVECGWFDARRQIGLSGRTVNAKLIITVGISGSVQFAAGMRGSALIVAINRDRSAPIFDIAHYGLVGDLYEVLPRLAKHIREENANG